MAAALTASPAMSVRSCRGVSAGGYHRLSYVEWGDAANARVALCVHGLTRNARDFDHWLRALARTYRVICPDVVGRGRSGWLTDPAGYTYPQYIADMAVVLAHAGADKVDLIGTSMGGLIGMMMAALDDSPIERLVINDIGPWLPRAARNGFAVTSGSTRPSPDLDAMERHLRSISAGFGPLTDDDWRHLCVHGAREVPGGYAYRYDPGIRAVFAAVDGDVDLWPVWSKVRQDVLVLRGAESDLLGADTARRMRERNGSTMVVEYPGVGHAPMLMSDDQVGAVVDWLG
ncbi:MAG: alpha/beta hydrolase [Gammaproteobacteria bacterium]|nr:alpha/beta hydrolase [Gammaproteobacteria bacterium]